MARNGVLTVPADAWVDLTDGLVEWLLIDVLDSTPGVVPGVYVRFQADDPTPAVTEGHVVRRGAGGLTQGAQMDRLGGRAWVRSMHASLPAQVFVTAVA